MKHKLILTLIIIFSFLKAYSQAEQEEKLMGIIPLVNGIAQYEKIITVDSTNKDEIYKRVKRWYANTYRSSKSVIDLDDRESGEFISKGNFNEKWYLALSYYDCTIDHKIHIRIKDNKLKIVINNITVNYYQPASQYTRARDVTHTLQEYERNNYSKKNAKKFLIQIDNTINQMISSLDTAVKNPIDDDF